MLIVWFVSDFSPACVALCFCVLFQEEVSPDGFLRKTHPLLVPFHALPAFRRDYNIKVVTQTLSTVLALGFLVQKPFAGEDTLMDANRRANMLNPPPAASPGAAQVSATQMLLAAQQAQQQAALNDGSKGTASTTGAGTSASSFSPLSLGSISPELLSLVDFLADSNHDLWSESKLARGFRWGPSIDLARKTHPGLVPYASLPAAMQEKERKQALKILGTLAEWGYVIQKDPRNAAANNATAGAAQPTADGGAANGHAANNNNNNNNAQPAFGSLAAAKRPQHGPQLSRDTFSPPPAAS